MHPLNIIIYASQLPLYLHYLHFYRWLFEWLNAHGYKTKIVPYLEWIRL